MKKKIFLIMGESGSGKSALVNVLIKRGYTNLLSYTTREPRYEGEDTHLFCTVEEYENYKESGEIVAYSYFDGNHYFSLKEQLYSCDIYVIDMDGIGDLIGKYDDLEFVVIYLKVDSQTRIDRMRERGDSEEQIVKRMINDQVKFKEKYFDYAIPNYNLLNATNIISYIIESERRN